MCAHYLCNCSIARANDVEIAKDQVQETFYAGIETEDICKELSMIPFKPMGNHP